MQNLFQLAEQVLLAADAADKVHLTHVAWQAYQNAGLQLDSATVPVLAVARACFPVKPTLVDPRALPKRKLNSREGRAALLHAVAHIEFSAIQLAFDHLYRFRDMPDQYYWDWLAVAHEEAEHFELLQGRLAELDVAYGDLPAHAGLWGIAQETAYDVLARMALVPRFMEARGLDVTPGIMSRLQTIEDWESVKVLQRIMDEEVGHVALGSRWFQWSCEQRQLPSEQTYFELVEKHLKGQARGPFNFELRRKAGFSESELKRLDKSQ